MNEYDLSLQMCRNLLSESSLSQPMKYELRKLEANCLYRLKNISASLDCYRAIIVDAKDFQGEDCRELEAFITAKTFAIELDNLLLAEQFLDEYLVNPSDPEIIEKSRLLRLYLELRRGNTIAVDSTIDALSNIAYSDLLIENLFIVLIDVAKERIPEVLRILDILQGKCSIEYRKSIEELRDQLVSHR